MKLMIATDSYRFTTSGVANAVIALADGLRSRGFQVKVLSLSNGRTSFKEGDDYFIRSIPSLLYSDVRASFTHSDPLLDELIQWKPDLIHLHTEGSIAHMARTVAEQTGAPIVMTAHTDYAYYAFGRFHSARPVRWLMKSLGKRVYRNIAAVTVPSEKARAFPQLSPVSDRVFLVPNGIKLERYQRPVSQDEKAALFKRWGMTDTGCTLVMVTRVSREKNIMEILHFLPALIREMPNAHLLIVGDGPDRKRLEGYCADNNLTSRVTFTGRISPEEVYRYYAMGDVFVSASVFEVHSLSYLEALACGLPLVCREDESLKGVLIDGEDGFIYRTEAEFVRAVKTLLTDRALKQKMHENALRKAEKYSDRRFVENMIAQYEKTLAAWKAKQNR